MGIALKILKMMTIQKKRRPSQDPNYRKWHSELKARNPEMWLVLIKALPDHLHNGVGRIVWWDYFADRTASTRWDHLDWCLQSRDEPDIEEWQAALMLLGYPEAAAKRRVNRYQKFFKYSGNPENCTSIPGHWYGKKESLCPKS